MRNAGTTILDWGKVRFFLGEVARSFTRNKGMQATAIGTVAVTVAMLGTFLFVREILTAAGGELLNQIEISVYLQNGVSIAQVDDLRTTIAHDERVAAVDFIPKKQGLQELRSRLKGQVDASILTENPLPDKLRVRARDPQDVAAIAAWIQTLPRIATVDYGQRIVQRLLQLGAVLHRVGLAVIAVFLFVAGVIIANTIRLTVFARRREIAIMQLVGATNLYIRAPFICEGLLDGLLGASIAVLVLVAAHVALWPRLLEALPFPQLASAGVDAPLLIVQLFIAGGAIGVIASWISVGRYLRT